MIFLAQIQTGFVDGNFTSFEETTSEVFWTTMPIGFAFAMIVWIGSATVAVVFKTVKQG